MTRNQRGLSDSFVGLEVDGELLGAVGVRAFAEENRRGFREAVPLLEARDVLVDLAEERLVAGGPLLPQWRHDRPPG